MKNHNLEDIPEERHRLALIHSNERLREMLMTERRKAQKDYHRLECSSGQKVSELRKKLKKYTEMVTSLNAKIDRLDRQRSEYLKQMSEWEKRCAVLTEAKEKARFELSPRVYVLGIIVTVVIYRLVQMLL